MDIEVKEFGSNPDRAQRSLLMLKHQLISNNGRNVANAVTRCTRVLKSTYDGADVLVRYLGTHLLQFEKTCPTDSAWIKWDYQEITAVQLAKLLAIELNPYDPSQEMDEILVDRHATRRPIPNLFAGIESI